MKFPTMTCALLAGILLAMTAAGSANASTVSQREYRPGYNDCIKGAYDHYQHGVSYKRGCRAAEDRLAKRKMPATVKCPPDISQADRYKYPGCG